MPGASVQASPLTSTGHSAFLNEAHLDREMIAESVVSDGISHAVGGIGCPLLSMSLGKRTMLSRRDLTPKTE